MTPQDSLGKTKIYSKKCPYCSTILKLSDTECHACRKKVGDPDKNGIAMVPGKWKTYASALFAFGLLIGWFYIWWKYDF